MYKVVTMNGKKEFIFQRPDNELNKVLHEFYNNLKDYLQSKSKAEQKLFIKGLLDLIVLCELPTKNHYKIEEATISFSHTSFNYYFHFSTTRISKTNELIESTPQLFESSETYFLFLSAIKSSLRLAIIEAQNNEMLSGQDDDHEEKPLTLLEIFGEHYELCISALKNVTPPILNPDGKYALGKRKSSAIAVWFKVCEDCGKIKKTPTLAELRLILKREFNLKVSQATLSGTNDSTAKAKYKNQLLSKLK